MIHYNNALNPTRSSIPMCRPNAQDLKTTTDIDKITCKNCQKRFDLSLRQAKGWP